jgi:hypothetical protein
MNGDGFDQFYVDPEELARQQHHRTNNGATAGSDWNEPDMGVLRLRQRDPPRLPIEVFGDAWSRWITDAAIAASCPPDYVALPLLASASTLIGHARWAQATEGWSEPPHLWCASVGDSGAGKSPGADCLMREVLPEIEHRMIGDFPDRLKEWQAEVEFIKAREDVWKKDQRDAIKKDTAPPPCPPRTIDIEQEPQRPRLRQTDVTIEKVALIVATAALKGVLITRDELAGWLIGMGVYNPAGREFWIEAYGGRPYLADRVKHKIPIDIPRLAVAVCGGTQPEKLAKLMVDADDGLLARFQWAWPEPIPFELGRKTPRAAWAIKAFDQLRELDLQPSARGPRPVIVPLTADGEQLIETFGREMQARQDETGGLLRSAFGKARGTALRTSIVLEHLWWCAKDGMDLPPAEISTKAFVAAAVLVSDYFMPMAERVYGDAGATATERMAATLARWIVRERPDEVHIRHLQREVRLPGLRTAEQIKKAAEALIDADWLSPPIKTVFGQPRSRAAYAINPRLYGA